MQRQGDTTKQDTHWFKMKGTMAELEQEGARPDPTVASGQDKLSEPQRTTDQVHPPHLTPESWPYTYSEGDCGKCSSAMF